MHTEETEASSIAGNNGINTSAHLDKPRIQPAPQGPVGSPELSSRLGNGHKLDAETRKPFEDSLGVDFSDVLLYSGARAAYSAAHNDAAAYTYGNEIVFGRNQLATKSPYGKKLLAHELTHVAQQKAGGPRRLRRQPPASSSNGADDDAGFCEYVTPEELMSYGGPETIVFEIDVSEPHLPEALGGRSVPAEHLVLHDSVQHEETINLWAVPINAILSSGTADSAGREVVQTTEGPTEVVHRTAEHFITNRYHKLAVGAGSVSLYSTPDGVVLVDAGVHHIGRNVNQAIADAAFNRLQGIIGNRPIIELLLSHLHLDHTALVKRIASAFELRSISTNAVQVETPHFRRLSADVLAARVDFRAAQAEAVRAQLATERAAWEQNQSVEPRQEVSNRRWNQYVEQRVQMRLAEIPAVQLNMLIPHEGRLHSTRIPLDQSAATAGNRSSLLRDAVPASTSGRAAFGDPALEEALTTTTERQRVSRMDRYSTSYIIDVGNIRLLVLPDLRASDVQKIMREFQAEASRLGSTPQIRVWDMSHHLQIGFRNINASKLGEFTRQLHTLRMQAGGHVGSDLLVVSARHDVATSPRNPRAQSFIDPATVYILESLGYRVMPAVSGHDVEVLEVLTSRGQRVTGVVAGELGHTQPSEALLRRSNAAIDQLANENRLLRRRMRNTRLDPAERTTMTTEMQTNSTKMTAIRERVQSYTEAVTDAIGRSLQGTSRPAVHQQPAGPEPAAVEARALRAELSGFTEATTSTNPRFTSEALVVMRHEAADSLTGESRELLEARNRVSELRRQLETSTAPHETRARLIAELMEYQVKLEPVIPTEPGASRTVLADELESVRREIRTHVEDPAATRKVSRLPGTGDRVETRVLSSQRLATQETTAQRVVSRGLKIGGRALGGVMVYQLIHSQEALDQRYLMGAATELEMLAGTTHNVLGTGIGIRMIMAKPVPGVGFAVLAALDILQTAARDHESDEARNTDVTYSVIRNSLTLAAMGAGHLLIKTRHPAAMIAGFALMFVVDPILEALGVYNWLERRFAYLPSDVTGVRQDLRDLMEEYRVLVGTLDLLDRGDEELTGLGISNVSSARRSGRDSLQELRNDARNKELEVLEGFEEAYEEARTSYGGLVELDAWRTEFLQLQHRVNPAGEGIAARENQISQLPSNWRYVIERGLDRRPIRSAATETFEAIEQTLNLDGLSPNQIREMDQWEELDDELDDLIEKIADDELNYKDIAKNDRKVQRMLAHARYRLEPGQFGPHRETAFFSDNSPAKIVYEIELRERQGRYADAQIRLSNRMVGREAITPRAPRPPPRPICSPDQVDNYLPELTSRISEALDLHDQLRSRQPSPPAELSETTIHRSSFAMAVEYPEYVAENDSYRHGLESMYCVESTITSLLQLATNTQDGPQAIGSLENRFRLAIENRREERGFYTVLETQNMVSEIREFENAALTRRLAPAAEAELECRAEVSMEMNPFEMEAVAEETLGGQSDEMTTLINRIRQIPALEVPDLADPTASGQVSGIRRFAGSYGYQDWLIFGIPGEKVTADDNVLVGLTGERRSTTHGRFGHSQELKIIPLNEAAIRLFGGPQAEWVLQNYLYQVEITDIRP